MSDRVWKSSEPPDGLLTTEGLLTVRGQTEPQVDISVNETPIAVDDEGNFRTQLFLKEGQNEIAIEAISPIGRQEDGLRTSVRRTVLRDTRAPEIVIDSAERLYHLCGTLHHRIRESG